MAVEHIHPARGDVYLIEIDPTRGSEIRKTRPCLVISPDELNQDLRTVIVVPMTTGGQAYPWRIRFRFRDRAGFVAMDQLRTVDRERLSRRLGRIAHGSPRGLAGNVHAVARAGHRPKSLPARERLLLISRNAP